MPGPKRDDNDDTVADVDDNSSCLLPTTVGTACQSLKERLCDLFLQSAKMWHLSLMQARVWIFGNVINLFS